MGGPQAATGRGQALRQCATVPLKPKEGLSGPPAASYQLSEESLLRMHMGLPQSDCAKIKSITYLSDLSEVNSEHDNLDVHVTLEDGREFTFVVATPNNVFWCTENEGIDYFFGEQCFSYSALLLRTSKRRSEQS